MGGVQKWVWYLGELESYRSVSSCSSAFDFVAVDVTQFRHPISEQVVKIHHRFVVRSYDSLIAVVMLKIR